MLSELEIWLDSNKLIVFSLIIPLVSIAGAAITSRYSVNRAIRSQETERNMQRVIKLAEFRQNWIDELRFEFSQFLGFIFGGHRISSDEMTEFNLVFSKILLRMNHDDPDFVLLMNEMNKAMDNLKDPLNGTNNPNKSSVSLQVLMGKILKREWNRLKSDLRDSEYGGGLE